MSAYSSRKLTANANVSKKNVLLVNFIGGVAWGLGSVIGATVFVAILVYALNLLGLFDAFKDYLPQAKIGNIQLYRSN